MRSERTLHSCVIKHDLRCGGGVVSGVMHVTVCVWSVTEITAMSSVSGVILSKYYSFISFIKLLFRNFKVFWFLMFPFCTVLNVI
jgi:hypothetical protein